MILAFKKALISKPLKIQNCSFFLQNTDCKNHFHTEENTWGNSKHKHRLGGELIKTSPGEKELGLLVDRKLNVSWLATQKANHILACITSSVASMSMEAICLSKRPHPEFCIQLRDPNKRTTLTC